MLKVRRLAFIALLAIVLLPLGATNTPIRAEGGINKDALQKLLDQAVENGLVGVSAAVYPRAGDIVLASAGVSDNKSKTPLTVTDIARIASCSKVWVGTVALQLIEE